ncbi:MAG: hypothetical protein MI748_02895 [Opitutales bacterium]|nr:hypothetical protein [Opitutales bacterium]
MIKRYKWMAAGLLLGAILFGSALGTMGTMFVLSKIKEQQRRQHEIQHVVGKGHGPIHMIIERLDRDLNLDPEQREKIQAEVEKIDKAFKALHAETGKKMSVIMEDGSRAIRAHLKEDQIAAYELYIEERSLRKRIMRYRMDSRKARGEGQREGGRRGSGEAPFRGPPPHQEKD